MGTQTETLFCVWCGLEIKGYSGGMADYGTTDYYMHEVCTNLILRVAKQKGWKIDYKESEILQEHIPRLVVKIKKTKKKG